MSKARKHLTKSNGLPVPTEKEKIVKVLEIRGSNQVNCQFPNGSEILCLMPNKFQKVIWISKGHYLIIKEAEVTSNTSGFQIKGIIVHILQDDAVKNLRKLKVFPKEFDEIKEVKKEEEHHEEQEEEEEEETQGNPNRVVFSEEESDQYTTDEEENEKKSDQEDSEEEIEEIDDSKKVFFNRRTKGKK